MPSFAGSSKELAAFARAWRLGKASYRDLFEEVPGADGGPSTVRMRLSAQPINIEAWQECNRQWVNAQVRQGTRESAASIRILQKDPKTSKKQIELMLRKMQAERQEIRRKLNMKGALLGPINMPTKPSEASKGKVYLAICLGMYLG